MSNAIQLELESLDKAISIKTKDGKDAKLLSVFWSGVHVYAVVYLTEEKRTRVVRRSAVDIKD